MDLTNWIYVPIDDNSFKLVPSRRILNPQIDYPNLFFVSVDGQPRDPRLVDYRIVPDYNNQEVLFFITYLSDIKGERLRV